MTRTSSWFTRRFSSGAQADASVGGSDKDASERTSRSRLLPTMSARTRLLQRQLSGSAFPSRVRCAGLEQLSALGVRLEEDREGSGLVGYAGRFAELSEVLTGAHTTGEQVAAVTDAVKRAITELESVSE